MAIVSVLRQAAREVYRRLMDAVDPALVDQAERTLRAADGVLGTGQVRLRWVGHQLRAECEVVVAAGLTAAPPTRSRSTPSTTSCTRSRGWRARWCTPTRPSRRPAI